LVVATLVAAAAGWKLWQDKQKGAAATLYQQMQTEAEKRDAKAVRDLSAQLADSYAGTAYAGMGGLISAKVQSDAGDDKNAKAQLAWVAEKAGDAAMRDLARLRLAALLLDDKAYDEALAQLNHEPQAGFAARFAEMKG